MAKQKQPRNLFTEFVQWTRGHADVLSDDFRATLCTKLSDAMADAYRRGVEEGKRLMETKNIK